MILNVLDLFSGIGGFSLGLESTGFFKTIGFCETDRFCQRILEKHWPDVKKFADVRRLSVVNGKARYVENKDKGHIWEAKTRKRFNVVCGGFPCQGFSIIGKRRGFKDERSGLWVEMRRIIKECQPDYAIVENVANLRKTGLASILTDFRALGYDAEWKIISASQVGAPHRRNRIWIVAYPSDPRAESLRKWEGPTFEVFGDYEPAHTDGLDLRVQPKPWFGQEKTLPGGDGQAGEVAHPGSARHEGAGGCKSGHTEYARHSRDHIWGGVSPQPGVHRMDDGLPSWVDEAHNARGLHGAREKERQARVKALGNSLVPQIARWIGLRIVEREKERAL